MIYVIKRKYPKSYIDTFVDILAYFTDKGKAEKYCQRMNSSLADGEVYIEEKESNPEPPPMPKYYYVEGFADDPDSVIVEETNQFCEMDIGASKLGDNPWVMDKFEGTIAVIPGEKKSELRKRAVKIAHNAFIAKCTSGFFDKG
jgi:hypothetical protein